MRDWNYAQLAGKAKQMGGPEKMLEVIASNARLEGRMDMVPWIGAAVMIGYGARWVAEKMRRRFERCREEAKKAEEKLIKAIEEKDPEVNQTSEATA